MFTPLPVIATTWPCSKGNVGKSWFMNPAQARSKVRCAMVHAVARRGHHLALRQRRGQGR